MLTTLLYNPSCILIMGEQWTGGASFTDLDGVCAFSPLTGLIGAGVGGLGVETRLSVCTHQRGGGGKGGV